MEWVSNCEWNNVIVGMATDVENVEWKNPVLIVSFLLSLLLYI